MHSDKKNIVQKIIDVSKGIHGHLGSVHSQGVYQRCLAIEFDKFDFKFHRNCEKEILYGSTSVGKRRAAFLIGGKILVQVKSQSHLTEYDFAQLQDYLNVYDMEKGILLNFGAAQFQFKCFRNKKMEEMNKAVQQAIDDFDRRLKEDSWSTW